MQLELFNDEELRQLENDEVDCIPVGSEYYVYHKTVKGVGIYSLISSDRTQILFDKKLDDEVVRKMSDLLKNYLFSLDEN